MERKYKEEEEEYEGMDEEELEAEEQEMLRKKHFTPKKPIKKINKVEKQEPVQRYVAFSQPSRFGVMDAETGEVVGEGEYAILQVLSNILTRLERIESNIGNLIGN